MGKLANPATRATPAPTWYGSLSRHTPALLIALIFATILAAVE